MSFQMDFERVFVRRRDLSASELAFLIRRVPSASDPKLEIIQLAKNSEAARILSKMIEKRLREQK